MLKTISPRATAAIALQIKTTLAAAVWCISAQAATSPAESEHSTPSACASAAECVAGQEHAVASRDFNSAIRHAASGCADHLDLGSCRRLANLAILIGNGGSSVPGVLAERLKDAAERTCRSSYALKDIIGRDVTGRECAHLARAFVLARHPDYLYALSTPARLFFESIYEPGRAAQLYQLACGRFQNVEACAARQRLAAGQ